MAAPDFGGISSLISWIETERQGKFYMLKLLNEKPFNVPIYSLGNMYGLAVSVCHKDISEQVS
jgi:hypothetical protein